jgi:lysozyme
MNRDKVAYLITKHEGKRYFTYIDTAGLPTIGIGFNLERVGARTLIEELKLDYSAVCNGTCRLDDIHINKLFEHDLDEAIKGATNAVGNLAMLPDDVQAVVVDMVFNLGFFGFRNFRRMIQALEKFDYCTAAVEMGNSKWAQQVPNRATENIELVKQFCEEVKA